MIFYKYDGEITKALNKNNINQRINVRVKSLFEFSEIL